MTNTENDEDVRLRRVQEMGLLDNLEPEERFDVFTRRAVAELHVPISTLTILDADKGYYKSCQGLTDKEESRTISFCSVALMATKLFVVSDCLKDPRFANNPMVTGSPFIRFYAGIALNDHKTGLPVAVFCIKDRIPRELTPSEVAAFLHLADEVEKEINK
jgi:GAF domain-containing protein